jgi:hypothetical protein
MRAIAGLFSRRRPRPRTNSVQRADDEREDAALALRFPEYEEARRRGRARSPSPRARLRSERSAMRDAEWAAAEEARLAAQPSLARRALNLAQLVSRGVQNVSRRASQRASQGAQIASNYLWDRAAAAVAAAAAAAVADRRAAAAAAAARRAIADANDAAARQRLQPAAAAADRVHIAAAHHAAAAADAAADAAAAARRAAAAADAPAAPAAPANVDAPAANKPDLECSICMTDAIVGQVAGQAPVLTHCNHRFHQYCINRWLAECRHTGNPERCPYCRGTATPLRLALAGGGGFKKKYRRTRSKSKSRRYPRKPHKTRKV